MKKSIELFSRMTYQNEPTNQKRVVISADSLAKSLGAAKAIRVQLIGYRITPGCELTLSMHETAHPSFRPNEVVAGGTPFHTSGVITTLRPAPYNIGGPFCDNVCFTLQIKHTTDAAQVEFDGQVYVTLILEE